MADNIEKTIADYIAELVEIKKDIANAVNGIQEDSIDKDTGFGRYAEIIRGLSITNELKDEVFTSNGEYGPPDGFAGYKNVKVNIEGGSGYDSDYSGGDWSGSGSGGSGDWSGSGSSDLEDKYADDDLPKYTVTFINPEDESFENVEVEVEYGGSASYSGPTPHKEGNYAWDEDAGWDPMPTCVTSDITVKAVFYSLNEEIEDSWKKIVEKKGGRPYRIWQYKTITTDTVTWKTGADEGNKNSDGHHQKSTAIDTGKIKLVMQKIYEGEDGTTSTWLSKIAIEKSSGGTVLLPMHFVPDDKPINNFANSNVGIIDGYGIDPINYDQSYINTWLNDVLYPAIPQIIREAIVSVSKTSNGYPTGTEVATYKPLWIPAISEIYIASGSDLYEDMNRYPGVTPRGDITSNFGINMWTRSKKPGDDSGNYVYYGFRINTYSGENVSLIGMNEGTQGCIRVGFCL